MCFELNHIWVESVIDLRGWIYDLNLDLIYSPIKNKQGMIII